MDERPALLIDRRGEVFVVNQPDTDYFRSPIGIGEAVLASWDAADVHVLTKVDTGRAGDPYLDAAE